jgi:hypothetical protein
MRRLKKLPRTWIESIQQMSIIGTPDTLICCNGNFVALEYKKDAKAKLDPMQEYKLNKIRKAGGMAFVAHPDNFEYIYGILENLAHGLQSRETKASK